MKLAMFTNVESYRAYLNGRISAAKKAVELRESEYREAVDGVGKVEWLEFNKVSAENRESAWNEHLKWRLGCVKDAKKKLRRFEKELAQLMMA